MLKPQRTLEELKELRELTGDANGAQRVAWTPVWEKAREWFREKVGSLPVEVRRDAAGNVWTTLRGRSSRALLIGGHLDSVPNGGWLDGCLNVMAGLEVMRGLHAEFGEELPWTVRLVDWADEEGARFGKSLFGSSACSGNLDVEEARRLVDRNGVGLPEALRECGIELDRVLEAGGELAEAAAYLELHIEQGPVLLDLGLPLGAVLGTFGVERHLIRFRGQAAHSGSTPMHRRRDAFLAAARMAPEIYAICERLGGVGTIGLCRTRPGIVTSVVEACEVTLDLRHLDAEALADMQAAAVAASERFAEEGKVGVEWERIWSIEPVLFDPELIGLAR
ncbi:MAG: hydantoinase/carbamoylase family amidase, partial [Verrucomicrobiia bacterium]